MFCKKLFITNWFSSCLLLSVIFSGCTKYETAENIPDAAYIRVFNSIATNVEPADGGGISPFLTFLMDPETDKNGVITHAPVMCDYFNTRLLYSASFPMEAGTDPSTPYSVITGPNNQIVYYDPLNFEYPGKLHVPAAPAMNGYDMSSWAQVKPGRHRIVFVVRPKNKVPFASLNEGIRKTVLIDTTIELQAGEVYTMQAIQTRVDNPSAYGLYVRTENFFRQSFEDNKIYVGFDNISGKRPLAAEYGYKSLFADTLNIFYSYLVKDFTNTAVSLPVMGMKDLFYTTVSKKLSGTISSYQSIPMIPRSFFFYKDSSLKTFPSNLFMNNESNGGLQKDEDMPFVRLDFFNQNGNPAGRLFRLNCSASPVTLPFYSQELSSVRKYQANLNLVLNRNNKVYIYPTVNILEMCYDRVYMMQMQRAFNQAPQ